MRLQALSDILGFESSSHGARLNSVLLMFNVDLFVPSIYV